MLNLSKLVTGLIKRPGLKAVGLASLLTVLAYGAPAQASVPLTRADIEEILNRVEFIPRGRTARTARSSDFLSIGDAIRTAAASRAELRFNDGSLARVGERATFRFIPNTRNFRLSDGTMLLLIPPGRGRSTIQTPSAVTGIQGSALVVRHVEARDLTMVMALTNNPAGAMTVTMANCDPGSECTSEYTLSAGEMVIIQGDQAEVLDFDLLQFYETSAITAGLELNNPSSNIDLGPDLNQVRQETLDALEDYTPIEEEQGIVVNPDMISVTDTDETVAGQFWLLDPEASTAPLTDGRSVDDLPAGLLSETSTSDPAVVTVDNQEEVAAQPPTPNQVAPPVVPGPAVPEPVVETPVTPVVESPPPAPVVETPVAPPPVLESPTPPVVETPNPVAPPVVEAPEPVVPPVVEIPNPVVPPVVEAPDPVVPPVVETPNPVAPPVVETPEPVVPPVVEIPDPVVPPVVEAPEPVVPPVVETPDPVVPPVVETPDPVAPPVVETPEPVVPPVVEIPDPVVPPVDPVEPTPGIEFPDKDDVPAPTL
jgi:hypothetical protein